MIPLRLLTVLSLLAVAAGTAFAQDKAHVSSPRLNRYIELMEAGKPAFGVFSSIVSTRNGAAMAGSGLDFVIVDLEHSPFDPSKLEGYLLGMISKAEVLKKGNLQPSVVPFIRVPSAGREQLQFIIKQVLDLGPMGLVVPHVDTAADARATVQACRYPQLKGVPDYEPAGKRGVGYGWAARYWGLSGAEYGERADVWPLDTKGELALWLMIETQEAVDNCAEIARTPGVSGLFLGPSDLAFSMGVPLGDPAVEAAIEKVLAASKAAVPLGTLCGAGDVERRLAQGFRFLAVGGDAGPSASVKEAVSIGRRFKAKP